MECFRGTVFIWIAWKGSATVSQSVVWLSTERNETDCNDTECSDMGCNDSQCSEQHCAMSHEAQPGSSVKMHAQWRES